MRDLQRIENILELLKIFWKQNPDLRLGQILSIASDIDVFYVEDDKIMDWLNENIKEK